MTFKGLTHTQIASPNPCIQCPVLNFEQHLVLTYGLCTLGSHRTMWAAPSFLLKCTENRELVTVKLHVWADSI